MQVRAEENPLSGAVLRPVAGIPSPFRCPRGGVEEPLAQVTSLQDTPRASELPVAFALAGGRRGSVTGFDTVMEARRACVGHSGNSWAEVGR